MSAAQPVDVVVVGSINVDETLPVDAWPQPGETVLLAGAPTSGLGGKGANQAVAAALAGTSVAFVGAVGDDAGAATALAGLTAAGVDIAAVRRIEGVGTGRATILLHRDGENLILVDPGANATVSIVDVARARDLIAGAAVVLVQGEVAPDVIDATAAVCRDTGIRFVLNLAPPVAVATETLATADPLIVNELEAAHLGIDPAAATPAPARSVVVTLGAKGAVAITADGRAEVPSPRVTPVDTTGAGDAFAGTLSAALANGSTLADACRAGAAAGAFAVTRPGASASYGTSAEIQAAGLA
jgi:ribokinase